MKKILHVSHQNPDIDAVASMSWGKSIFGGDIFIPDTKLLFSTRKVIEDFNISFISKIEKEYDYTFIYDTSLKEDTIIASEKYVIFDHHSKKDENFFKNAIKVFHKANSANVINLYELSIKWKMNISERMKFLFAIAIYSDTGILRTARKEQLVYISKLMGNHTVEDLTKYACPHRFGNDFIKKISRFSLKNGVLYGIVKNGDEFYGVADSLFKVMDAKVLCCKMEGKNIMKFLCDKSDYQWLIQRILKPFSEKYGVRYAHTNLYGLTDFDKIISFIKENGG